MSDDDEDDLGREYIPLDDIQRVQSTLGFYYGLLFEKKTRILERMATSGWKVLMKEGRPVFQIDKKYIRGSIVLNNDNGPEGNLYHIVVTGFNPHANVLFRGADEFLGVPEVDLIPVISFASKFANISPPQGIGKQLRNYYKRLYTIQPEKCERG